MGGCSGNGTQASATHPSSNVNAGPDAGGDSGSALSPLPGTTRFALTMDSFTLAPNEEIYKCQDFPNPGGKDIAILRSESVMTRGSHHMFAFRVDSAQLNLGDGGTQGPLVDCPSGGVEFHPYFHDAQIPKRVTTYPPGVGRALKGTEGVRLMVHYLNTGSEALTTRVTLTADYVDASAVDALAAEYFLNATGVVVKPGTTTQTFSYTLPSSIHVLSAVSHMHRHGVHFEAESQPGGVKDAAAAQALYRSDEWLEPTPTDFDPPREAAAGDVFRFTCTFQNDDGTTFTFGESARTNEMCIFQGTFYPAPGGNGLVPFLFGPSE